MTRAIGLRDGPGAALRRDRALVEAVLAGDEAAFLALVDRLHPSMLRLARCFVTSDAVADAVVRHAWCAVMHEAGSWDAGSSLRAWTFGMVARLARLGMPERSRPDGGDPWRGGGEPWPEGWVGSRDMLDRLERAMAALPVEERAVMTLRDVEGCDATETCASLGFGEPQQRELLHRARSSVRAALDAHLRPAKPGHHPATSPSLPAG
jgi:RNA polymerase sigma-70 factor, ECF subfamily